MKNTVLLAGLLLVLTPPAWADLSEVGQAYVKLQAETARLRAGRKPFGSKARTEMLQRERELREAFVERYESKASSPEDQARVGDVLRRLGRDGRAVVLLGQAYAKLPPGPASLEVGHSRIAALYGLLQYDLVQELSAALIERYPGCKYKYSLDRMYRRIESARKEGELLGFAAPGLDVERGIGLAGSFNWADYRGRVVLLFFFGSYDDRSRAATGPIKALLARHPKQLAVVGATGYFHSVWLDGKPVKAAKQGDEFELLKKFHKQQALEFPVVITTTKVMEQVYRIGQVPYYVLIDKNGVVRRGQSAFGKWKELEAELERLVGEELPAPKSKR